jgi:hypothetical protein
VGLDGAAAASAIGLGLVLTVLLAWGFNPFLGLLAFPVAHAWIPQARDAPRNPARSLIAVVVCVLPVVLAAASVASRLHLGVALPWQAIVAVGDWGLAPISVLSASLATGWLASLVVASRA